MKRRDFIVHWLIFFGSKYNFTFCDVKDNIVAQWAVTTSVDFSLAQLIQVIILLATGGNNGGGYLASKYVVMAFHGGILLLHAIINSLSITWLSFFRTVSCCLEFLR